MKKLLGKAMAFICMAALCICMVPAAVIAAEEEDLDEKIARLQAEVSAINSQIASTEGTIADAEYLKNQYQQQQQALQALLEANQESITESEAQIAQKQLEISATMQSIYENQALFEERMLAMYKSRTESTLSTLLSVNTFSELLTVVKSLQRISTHDTQLIQNLANQKEQLESEKAQLETLVSDLGQKNEEQQQNVQMLAVSIEKQDDAIDAAQAEQEAQALAYGETYSELQQALNERAAQEQLMAEIAAEAAAAEQQRLEEEAAQQAAEEAQQATENADSDASDPADASTGAESEAPVEETPTTQTDETHSGSIYLWPVPGHYSVSCEFGQPDPSGLGHRGMDINDGSISGAAIIAAGSGTVLRAGWHSSYGNYVSISHGNGVVTLYAHLQSYNVYVGQYVEAGATIGAVGNTGYVVGANGGYHLHFEVQVNGVLQNPRNYVSA